MVSVVSPNHINKGYSCGRKVIGAQGSELEISNSIHSVLEAHPEV